VRVVDKDVAGGRLYLKKAWVVSVPEPRRCHVHLDDGSHWEVRPSVLLVCKRYLCICAADSVAL
jgi:hypothetical protein